MYTIHTYSDVQAVRVIFRAKPTNCFVDNNYITPSDTTLVQSSTALRGMFENKNNAGAYVHVCIYAHIIHLGKEYGIIIISPR